MPWRQQQSYLLPAGSPHCLITWQPSRYTKTLKVKGSKVKVTAWRNSSAVNVISQKRISWPSSMFVKINPMRSAELTHVLRGHRSNKPEMEKWQHSICTVKKHMNMFSDAKLMFSFTKSGSLNLRVMSEYWPEARKSSFIHFDLIKFLFGFY